MGLGNWETTLQNSATPSSVLKEAKEADIGSDWQGHFCLQFWLRHEVSAPTLGLPPEMRCGCQREKRATEDEMLRYHHQLNGHEPEKTAGDSDGQGNLACCSP